MLPPGIFSVAVAAIMFPLPAQGASLLFSRTFFSLQRPWVTTALAIANMVVNALVSFALYSPLGVQGVVLGSVAGTLVMAVSQAWLLRSELGGIEGAKTLMMVARMLVATAVLSGVSYLVWLGIDAVLGRSLAGQIVSVGTAIVAGIAAYGWLVTV